MGWQLVPTGIGWRAFNKTLEEGRFACDNPRCKGRTDVTQPYRLRRSKNWFTVLFIPIIPLNVKGVYVECRACKTVFHASVLSDAAAPDVVTADTSPSPMPVDDSKELRPAPMTGLVVDVPPTAALLPDEPMSPTTASRVTHRARLVLDGGGSVEVSEITLVGRDPSPVDPYRDAAICQLEDPTMTMSKTHAAFGVDASGVWVDDLGAANGVVIALADEPDRVVRSERAPVPTGATVLLGELALRVTDSTSG